MSETFQLKLPYLQPSQAQKHVTVNEGFARLDGLVQLTLQSRGLATPPAVAADGVTYSVPFDGVNAWAGQAGGIAIFSNGGWVFVTPKAGWRAWIADESVEAIFDGISWKAGALAQSPHGAASLFRVMEFDHVISAGAVSTTVLQIPANAMVFAASGRVVGAISGALATWQLGTPGNPDRFGNGLGKGTGSYTWGMLSQPMTYYATTPLILTATGGLFSAGKVRIAVHHYQVELPGL